mgnify:CR=1 FL=1
MLGGVRPYKQQGKVVGIEWREEKEISFVEFMSITCFISLSIILIGLLIKDRLKR